ncbi:MAG: glycosyltransferase family 8 protein [Lachnospiraceae bacterium]|nr:glycosyltransferase family 8 protein [Lachnospiraceae bacterium]
MEIYYRIFAARYLPDSLDRILYLDPDVIINGSLSSLYSTKLDGYLFAAASHTGKLITRFNDLRLDRGREAPYINSGVMLMNLGKLRAEQNADDVYRFIEERRIHLLLPDQDIISSLYGSRIFLLDPFRYNMTEWLYMKHSPFKHGRNIQWVRENSVIIHYCGRNKPWKANYIGQLGVFYREAERSLEKRLGKL